MNPAATLPVALRALRRNPLRSGLTALGIIIGVAAVIAMVSIGEGAKARVQQAFGALGTNVLVVMSGSRTAGGARGGGGSSASLTWDDLDAIRSELPAVRYAAPQLRSSVQVVAEGQNWATMVTGTTPDYFLIRSWNVASGAAMTSSDVDSRAKLVWLGKAVADNLFGPYADPTGQLVRLRNVPFQVAGVLEKKGQSPTGQDYDDTVVVPASTFGAVLQGGLKKFIGGTIFVGAVDVAQAESDIKSLLRDRHRVAPGGEDDFSVRNLAEAALAQQEGTETMTTLLASVAAVSLLVGGIGIMNIMLVSVTERTREIGLRMAVGARPADILMQFLIEALTLAVTGGLTGVALGVGVAVLLSSRFGWPMLVRSDIVVTSLAVSALVGVVFGLYPARRAAGLDPIEALRHE